MDFFVLGLDIFGAVLLAAQNWSISYEKYRNVMLS